MSAPGSTSRWAGARFGLALARRFARSPALARSASVVFVAGAFLLAMYVALQTLTLSGAQVAERDLGRFGASVGYGTVVLPPGDNAVVADLEDAARAAGATDPMVLLSAADVQLAPVAAGDEPSEVTLLEAPWASQPFPRRYSLREGRWPHRPGEVVLADPEDLTAEPGDQISALGGGTSFRVVGTADDRYARTAAVLAAPGTWRTFGSELGDRFPLLQAQPVLFWSGSSEPAVTEAFAAVAAAHGNGADSSRGAVEASLSTRDELTASEEDSWIERTPAGYTVPSFLLPIGAVLLAFGLGSRRFRRALHVLTSLGVRRSLGVTSLGLAAGAWCLVAACLGAAAGTGIGLAGRSLIAHLRGLPAGPIPDVGEPVLRLVIAVGLGTVLAAILLRFTGSDLARDPRAVAPTPPGSSGRWQGARHLLAVAVLCATVVLAVELDSPADAMIVAGVLTVGVLLLVPEWIDLVLRAVPERGPRTRLSRRQLMADRPRAVAAVALLALIIGGSLGYLTLLDTMVRTADEQRYPEVLPGQMLVADRGSVVLPPPQGVLEVVEAAEPAAGLERLDLRYLYELDRSGNPSRAATLENTIQSVLALESAEQVERLLDHPLTPAQAAVLGNGGVLVWADAEATTADSGRRRLVVTSGDTPVGPPVEVPAATVAADDAGWRVGTSGVLLAATAERLGLPLTTGAAMYTGVSASAGRALQDAVVRAGQDARTVQLYHAPPPAVPPAALLATAAGLVILVIVLSLVATHGQGRTLRGYLGRLVSIGLPIGWARDVLLYQQAVIVALATALGALIAILPVVVATARISGFVLSVPWTQILVLLACIYASAGLAALLATRRLRAGTDGSEHAR